MAHTVIPPPRGTTATLELAHKGNPKPLALPTEVLFINFWFFFEGTALESIRSGPRLETGAQDGHTSYLGAQDGHTSYLAGRVPRSGNGLPRRWLYNSSFERGGAAARRHAHFDASGHSTMATSAGIVLLLTNSPLPHTVLLHPSLT